MWGGGVGTGGGGVEGKERNSDGENACQTAPQRQTNTQAFTQAHSGQTDAQVDRDQISLSNFKPVPQIPTPSNRKPRYAVKTHSLGGEP